MPNFATQNKLFLCAKNFAFKIQRRLRNVFIWFKHFFWFWLCDKNRCFCSNSHQLNLFENFRPTIQEILQSFTAQNRLREFFTDKVKLKALCNKILAGNLWLFDAELEQFESFAPDWFGANGNIEFVSSGQKFSWNVWNAWQMKLAKNCCPNPDIRIIWEKSRLQFLLPLALQFEQDPDLNIINFVEKILEHWLESNRFLAGANWTCAMEAAIRATSLIWLGCLLPLRQDLKMRITQSLCLHQQFIFDTWEDFYKPNNHLLADILGSMYLAGFFGQQQLLEKYLKQFDQEIARQVGQDSLSYENSTGYHKLATEFLLHRQALAQALNLPQSPETQNQLSKMLHAVDVTDFARTGDDDSGKFLFGLKIHPLENAKAQNFFYKDFGLWLHRSTAFKASLRTPVHKPSAPSGHLHQDFLTLNLNFRETPIFVDPGSGFYTKHPRLRNLLRSAACHTTFFPAKVLYLPFSQNLFCLEMPVTKIATQAFENKLTASYSFKDCHMQRELSILNSGTVEVVDTAQSTNLQPWIWNFVLAPETKLEQINYHEWLLKFKEQRFLFHSECALQQKNIFYAPNYSKISRVLALRGGVNLAETRVFKHSISRL